MINKLDPSAQKLYVCNLQYSISFMLLMVSFCQNFNGNNHKFNNLWLYTEIKHFTPNEIEILTKTISLITTYPLRLMRSSFHLLSTTCFKNKFNLKIVKITVELHANLSSTRKLLIKYNAFLKILSVYLSISQFSQLRALYQSYFSCSWLLV